MNKDRKSDELENGLRRLGDSLRDQDMPQSAGLRWRQAVRDRADTKKVDRGTPRKERPRFRIPGRYVAAAVLVLMVASLMSPTVVLYAGSLPGVGAFFRMVGADRGLQLALDQGVAQDLHMTETIDGVTLELVNVVADTSRTVLGFRITADEGRLDEKTDIMASITDQWGNTLASRGAFYRTSHEDGCTVLTGLVTHDGMQRLTRHINVKVTRIGDVGGPWEFRVPVSYEQAAAREREVEIGVISDETAGVRLEVASVQLHATETVITYIYHGLQGGSAEIRHRADSYWRIPDLYTADGRRVLPISARPADDRPGDPLAIRVSYEPLPSDVVQLRVVDEAVGRCYSSPPYDPAPSGPTVSFSFSVSGDGSDRVLEPASPRAVELWDTVVEVREAFIDDGRVTITIRGTGGDLVRVVAWMLTDDQDRSLSLDELLPGHIMEPGINFEITYTYSIDDEVQTLELTLHDLLRRIPGPWEVQFSLPR